MAGGLFFGAAIVFLPIAPLTLIGLGIVAVPDVVLVIAQGGILPVLFLIPALLWAARRLRPHHTDLVVTRTASCCGARMWRICLPG